jgi:hypothetical protein
MSWSMPTISDEGQQELKVRKITVNCLQRDMQMSEDGEVYVPEGNRRQSHASQPSLGPAS